MSQTELWNQFVISSWERDLPTLTHRNFPLDLVEDTRMLSIVGPRRAGKTYVCFQLLKSRSEDIPKKNKLYLNFEDERLYPLRPNLLQSLWEAYLELINPDLTRPIYVVLDEIQNIPNWSLWVRRMHDQYPTLRLIITGSSSKLLSREMSTELRGRAISIEVFPYSFAEYLHAKGISWNPKTIAHSTQNIAIKQAFNDYFIQGGFPGILNTQFPELILQEYYKSMFARDLVERFKIENIPLFEDALRLQLQQFSSKSSLSSLEKLLIELGYSLSKNTLSNYHKYAKEAYILFALPIWSSKIKNQMRYPKKLYGVDHGLLRAIRFYTSEDAGRLLENIVYLQLRRTTSDLYYGQEGKSECDFLIKNGPVITHAIQVTYDMSHPKTRARELQGLEIALKTHPHAEGVIITMHERNTIMIGEKTVKVIPAWEWLLMRG
jgi:predicted AAA+ superfamily ATPase